MGQEVVIARVLDQSRPYGGPFITVAVVLLLIANHDEGEWHGNNSLLLTKEYLAVAASALCRGRSG